MRLGNVAVDKTHTRTVLGGGEKIEVIFPGKLPLLIGLALDGRDLREPIHEATPPSALFDLVLRRHSPANAPLAQLGRAVDYAIAGGVQGQTGKN